MAINTTPNLHLPQWTPNEKPSYLVDFNQAFAAIDTGFAGVKEGSDGAVQIATNAYNQATGALQTANQAQGGLNSLKEGLNPSVISLATVPSADLASLTATLIYNNAGATLVIGITANPAPTAQAIGTITLPENFVTTGLNGHRISTNHLRSGEGFLEELRVNTADNRVLSIYCEGAIPPGGWIFHAEIYMVSTITSARGIQTIQYTPPGALASTDYRD